MVIDKKNWMDAESECVKNGAHLTSIHSEEENAFVESNLDHQNAWTGFNKMYKGEWEWTDGTAVGYERWTPGGKY